MSIVARDGRVAFLCVLTARRRRHGLRAARGRVSTGGLRSPQHSWLSLSGRLPHIAVEAPLKGLIHDAGRAERFSRSRGYSAS